MEQSQAEVEVDQAVGQLLAELEPPLLQNQRAANHENSPRTWPLRCQGQRKNQAQLPKENLNKKRKQAMPSAQQLKINPKQLSLVNL